jgi:hypothetical protein
VESREIVKGLGESCLCTALDLLDATDGADVLDFIDVIIAKKDLVLFTTRDISTVLSTANLKLSADPALFAPLARVVGGAMKHYPKALYSCLPVLVGTLRTMLGVAMGEGGGEQLYRCVLMARTLEVLGNHKDVFKKHVVPVLLDYFRAGEGGEAVKAALQPGVHALLSLLSPVERNEMNRILEGGERNAFRAAFTAFSSGSFKGN